MSKELQIKLSKIMSNVKPNCKTFDDFLHRHLPICEYCQGFFIILLETQRKNRLTDEGKG